MASLSSGRSHDPAFVIALAALWTLPSPPCPGPVQALSQVCVSLSAFSALFSPPCPIWVCSRVAMSATATPRFGIDIIPLRLCTRDPGIRNYCFQFLFSISVCLHAVPEKLWSCSMHHLFVPRMTRLVNRRRGFQIQVKDGSCNGSLGAEFGLYLKLLGNSGPEPACNSGKWPRGLAHTQGFLQVPFMAAVLIQDLPAKWKHCNLLQSVVQLLCQVFDLVIAYSYRRSTHRHSYSQD